MTTKKSWYARNESLLVIFLTLAALAATMWARGILQFIFL